MTIDMDQMLSVGAVEEIVNKKSPSNPVVQVMELRKIQKSSGAAGGAASAERYRAVISDGKNYCQAMLATQLNELVQNGTLGQRCIVSLDEYIRNEVQGRGIVIILRLTKRSDPLEQIIGNPTNIEGSTPGAAPAAAPSAPSGAPMPRPYQNAPQSSAPSSFQQQRPPVPQTSSFKAAAPTTYTSSSGSDEPIYPIASLNPYQNRWTIKARVTAKSDKKTWNKPGGSSGYLFTVDLLDAEGGEIRATCFNQVADMLDPILEVGKVYYISKGQVKPANPKFNHLNNQYEISFDRSTTVELCEDGNAVPQMQFNFVSIRDIAMTPKDSVVDVIGVVSEVGNLDEITTKEGKQLSKRTVNIIDDSNASIELTLWRNRAEEFAGAVGSILLVRKCRVSDFSGKSLSALSSSYIELNPDLKEAHRLRGWYDQTGGQVPVQKLTQGGGGGGGGEASGTFEKKSFSQIKQEYLGFSAPAKFAVRGTVTILKHDTDPWYPACPGRDPQDAARLCNKKLFPNSSVWSCEKCGQNWDKPSMRYILNLVACDHTGSSWMTAFNEVGVQILGQDADTLYAWKEAGSDAVFNQVFENANFHTFNFKVRAKAETYQDDTRVKCSIVGATPVDFAAESRDLIREIQAYRALV